MGCCHVRFQRLQTLGTVSWPAAMSSHNLRKTAFLWKQNMPHSWVTYTSFVPGLIDITTDRVLHLRMSSSRVGHIDQSTARQKPPGKDYDLLYCSCFCKDIQTCQLGLEIKQYMTWSWYPQFYIFLKEPRKSALFSCLHFWTLCNVFLQLNYLCQAMLLK